MIIYHDQITLISESQRQLNICKSSNVIHYFNKLKNKNPMITLTPVKLYIYINLISSSETHGLPCPSPTPGAY